MSPQLPTHWLRRSPRTLLACLATTLWLSACGGGGTDTPPPPPPPPLGSAVTQTVGAAGGTVLATSQGAKVSLSFPAGALPADTAITVTPLQPAAGDVMSLKLEPGGVFFAQPVTVVLEYPAGQAPAASARWRQRLAGNDVQVPTTVDAAARTLTTRLNTFGGDALDALAKPAAAPASQAQAQARAQALRARPQAAGPAAGPGTLTATSTTTLADTVADLRRMVLIMQVTADFNTAYMLQAQAISLLQRRGEPEYAGVASAFVSEAWGTSCQALASAIIEAGSTAFTHASQFKPLREKLANWWRVEQTFNDGTGTCPSASHDQVAQALLSLMETEVALHKLLVQDARSTAAFAEPAAEVKAARQNKREIEALEDAAATLDLPPLPTGSDHARPTNARALATPAATPSGFNTLIQTALLDPVLVPDREAAWATARGASTLGPYPVLIDAYGAEPKLLQDAQYVLTTIGVVSKNSSGNTVASSALGIAAGLTAPTDPVRTATIAARSGGAIELSGDVHALECAGGGPETLKVMFETTEVASVSGDALGTTTLSGALASLTPAGLLAAAALPADDQATHPLRIRRVSPCNTALGIVDDVLATVTLDFAKPLSGVWVDNIGITFSLVEDNFPCGLVWVSYPSNYQYLYQCNTVFEGAAYLGTAISTPDGGGQYEGDFQSYGVVFACGIHISAIWGADGAMTLKKVQGTSLYEIGPGYERTVCTGETITYTYQLQRQ